MRRKLRFFLLLLVVLGLVNGAIVFTGKGYLYKTALYQGAGIDDLHVFPYNTIRASSQPKPWPRSADYNRVQLPEALRTVLEEYETTAFFVLQGGSIRQEVYWDNYSELRNSNSFSAAKSIVSILIGIALDEGRIKSLDQPVADFLSSFDTPEKRAIRIRDVLRMASGLDFYEAYNEAISDTTEAYYGTDLEGLVARLGVEAAPGTEFRYKSGDTQVLGLILQQATGRSLADYASEKLWQPLGAVHDAQWSLDQPGGSEKAYCCFYSNVHDFARIPYLYMHEGEFNGRQLVSADYVRESLAPIELPNTVGENTQYYGFQWWLLNHAGQQVFYARGILGQYLFAIPALDMVVVRLGHQRSQTKVNHHPEDVYAILDGVFSMYAGGQK
jgi:CubicO group peptidase (beta-lactamase class C family)